jgi:hypothetical protein
MKYPRIDDMLPLLDIVSDIRSIRGHTPISGSGYSDPGMTNNTGHSDVGQGPRMVRGVPSVGSYNQSTLQSSIYGHDDATQPHGSEYEATEEGQRSWLSSNILITPLGNIGSIGQRYVSASEKNRLNLFAVVFLFL